MSVKECCGKEKGIQYVIGALYSMYYGGETHLCLATYSCLVSLTNPNSTWNRDMISFPDDFFYNGFMNVKRLPKGFCVQYTSEF